ncbi:anthranilate phosphoribosyltransferase [Candidatus Nitrosocosmicus sp. FF01]|jgi:anthranilate phosphoribosyltransferase|uniref:anthranilate phosphoribosyltransferase n=1 Tax=Candidatus Nitrosocosmicus sp. FF01 TaxID=3397670 RepID=UPI0039EA42D2
MSSIFEEHHLAEDVNSSEEGRLLYKRILSKLSRREHLNHEEIAGVVRNIMEGKCSDIFISSFLMGLVVNGENHVEFAGVIDAVRSASNRITPETVFPIVDNCGTGGDMLNTFNISTAAAIIASSCKNLAIAKHGNRSSSGLSGSADFFDHVGYPLDNNKMKNVISSIESIGFGFLFAPNYHPGLKHVSHIRKELGIQTVFNKIGPLCNPCSNLYAQVIGVSDSLMLHIIPKIIPILGLKRAMIVRSEDGMDELSTTAKNTIVHVISEDGKYNLYSEILDPLSLGLPRVSMNEMIVKNKMDAINESLRVVYGLYNNKPKENIVLLNSAAVLVAGNRVESFKDGLEVARESIVEGRPQKLLKNLIKSIGDLGRLESAEKTMLNY